MDEPLLSLGVRKILERTTTCDEILDSGTYGPNNDVCCSKFLICKPGGDKDFQCPGCKMPAALVEEAKSAPLVVLRGRTDGTSDSSTESRIAQARAHAVRDYLVASGVDPSRIRTTHQPSGDHLADNRSTRGRNLNRRVEIEIYRVLPLSPQVSAPPQS